jgi:hypothetical protein
MGEMFRLSLVILLITQDMCADSLNFIQHSINFVKLQLLSSLYDSLFSHVVWTVTLSPTGLFLDR